MKIKRIKLYNDSRALFIHKETAEKFGLACEQVDDVMSTRVWQAKSRGQILGWHVSVRFLSTFDWYILRDTNVEDMEEQYV